MSNEESAAVRWGEWQHTHDGYVRERVLADGSIEYDFLMLNQLNALEAEVKALKTRLVNNVEPLTAILRLVRPDDNGEQLSNWQIVEKVKALREERDLAFKRGYEAGVGFARTRAEAAERERDDHQRERQRLAIQALQDLDRIEQAEHEVAVLRPYKALADEAADRFPVRLIIAAELWERSKAWCEWCHSTTISDDHDLSRIVHKDGCWLVRYEDHLAATAAEPAGEEGQRDN